MANFYTDNEDIKFHLGHPLMEKIVALKEQNYTQAEKYEDGGKMDRGTNSFSSNG